MPGMLSRVFASRWRPKNYHSLENLKYLHMVLVKNSTVTNQNRNLLVETLRSISEIMIWGDQNDSTVFDFFLEKNMLSYFKKIMKQKSGESVCVQLLQTLNILFENISHETSLYFLLSNNHVTSIIVHKFDFNDEEVMAYYISFLKILSLKLNPSTIHLFYSEQNKDFPLLTEALKFFNHSESMVRTAVRTITLSCFRVKDMHTRDYICEKAAHVYFANLTHDLGKLVLEIDKLARASISNSSMDKLRDLCAEHMDYLSYFQDIFNLGVAKLSQLLMEYLTSGLFLPLYLLPLSLTGSFGTNQKPELSEENPTVSVSVALFLLAHVFHIIHYQPIIDFMSRVVCSKQDDLRTLLSKEMLDNWPPSLIKPTDTIPHFFARRSSGRLRDPTKVYKQNFSIGELKAEDDEKGLVFGFGPSLTVPSASTAGTNSSSNVSESESDFDFLPSEQPLIPQTSSANSIGSDNNASDSNLPAQNVFPVADEMQVPELQPVPSGDDFSSLANGPRSPVLEDPVAVAVVNVIQSCGEECDSFPGSKYISTAERPFLSEVFYSMDCRVVKGSPKDVNDQNCLLSILFLIVMFSNASCNQFTFEQIYFPTNRVKLKHQYNCNLFEYLLDLLTLAAGGEMRVRSVTVEMACLLLREIVSCDVSRAAVAASNMKTTTSTESVCSNISNTTSSSANISFFITDQHLAAVENVKELSCLFLRRFYKGDDMFLDLFEDELNTCKTKPTYVSRLIQDAPIILQPISTPMSGISANRRLPCGEMELTKQAMSCFFNLRNLSLDLQGRIDTLLPLAKECDLVKEGDRLNLSNSDLLGCKVITKSGIEERFLVVGKYQLMFVEPDYSVLGWGVVKFTGPLQNTEVTGCADDNHSLQLAMHRPTVPPSPMTGPTSESLNSTPLFAAQLKFDDHIRVMAARQRIMKGRQAARQAKMVSIMELLEFPTDYIRSGSDGNASLQPFSPRSVPDSNSSGSSVSKSVTPSGGKISHSRKKKCYRSGNSAGATHSPHMVLPSSSRAGIHQMTPQLSVVTESPPPSCSKIASVSTKKESSSTEATKDENEEHEQKPRAMTMITSENNISILDASEEETLHETSNETRDTPIEQDSFNQNGHDCFDQSDISPIRDAPAAKAEANGVTNLHVESSPRNGTRKTTLLSLSQTYAAGLSKIPNGYMSQAGTTEQQDLPSICRERERRGRSNSFGDFPDIDSPTTRSGATSEFNLNQGKSTAVSSEQLASSNDDHALAPADSGYPLNSKALSHSALLTLSTYDIIEATSDFLSPSQDVSNPTGGEQNSKVLLTHTLSNQPEHCEDGSLA